MINETDLEAFEYYNAEEYVSKMTPLEMVREYQETARQVKNANTSARLIHEEYIEWQLERVSGSPESELKELTDLVYVCYGYAHAKGWDMVHENSMGSVYHPDGIVKHRLERFSGSTESGLKELTDLVYMCYGYANFKGWDMDESLRRVHENNMGRMYQPDGTIKYREDGKVLKNKEYPAVDLSDLV